MNRKRLFSSLSATILVLVLMAGLAGAQGPGEVPVTEPAVSPAGKEFTYQGRLDKDGGPVNGACSLRFKLWNALTGGAQVGPTLTRPSVVISDGFLTVSDLHFGAQFTGEARWLEVAVRCLGDSSYIVLSPRQVLTAAPVALSLALPFRAEASSDQPLCRWTTPARATACG